jgi:hypothetical protein
MMIRHDPRARVDIHPQHVAEETREVAFFPIDWEVVPIFAARGVTPSPSRPIALSEFVAWTRE